MGLYLDHAFLTCEAGAPVAEALRGLGFIEGSANSHPGQGTANRRFFFENFMLELLWVADPEEARSDAVRPTTLCERWSRRAEGINRVGLVYGGDPLPGAPALRTQSYYLRICPRR